MSILDKIRKRFKKDKVKDGKETDENNKDKKKDEKPKLVPFFSLVIMMLLLFVFFNELIYLLKSLSFDLKQN